MSSRRPLTFRGVVALLAGLALAIAANMLAAPILLYVAVLLFALVIIAVLPASLAHRWRSPDA